MTTSFVRLGKSAILLGSLLVAACRPEPSRPPPPPPLPTPIPSPEPPIPGAPPPSTEDAPGEPASEAPEPAPSSEALKPKHELKAAGGERQPANAGETDFLDHKLTPPAREGPKAAKTTPSTEQPAKPQPAPAPAVAPVAKPASKVVVPRTDHVHIDVPPGLQAYLDADPRMQPWSAKVVSIADKCYATELAKNSNVQGVIELRITMHENERPDADIKSLPPQLSNIVACASGQLMRTKMPLFTGREGDKQTVRLHFDN